jgi:hypothetical protein
MPPVRNGMSEEAPMRRYRYLSAVPLAAAVVATLLGATPVVAATSTWTVAPGGDFLSVKHPLHSFLTDTSTGAVFPCDSWLPAGSFKRGTGLANPIGKITTFYMVAGSSEVECSGNGLSLGITFNDLPLGIRAERYDSGTNQTFGAILKIDASLYAIGGYPACTATLDGTGPAADNGELRFKYFNAGGELRTFTAGTNLHFYDVAGCNGLIGSGDALTYQAWSWIASEGHDAVNTITSP